MCVGHDHAVASPDDARSVVPASTEYLNRYTTERLCQVVPNALISDARRRNSIHGARHRLLLPLSDGQGEVLGLATAQGTYLQGPPDLLGVERFLQVGGIG